MILIFLFIAVILAVILALTAYAKYQNDTDIEIIEEHTRQIKEDMEDRR